MTTEEKRKKLDEYCLDKTCSNCVLAADCRCGRGTSFLTKKGVLNEYGMSDDEIESAYNRAFPSESESIKSNLGKYATDKITGYTGVITAILISYGETPQYLIETSDGLIIEKGWLSMNRLEIMEEKNNGEN